MRKTGVRIQNVIKNIGEPRYAFNILQARALPKPLRPPEGTYGNAVA